ncbi:hypothetical protein ACQEUX_12210 [Micromonospora sp. CA-259024]|uniref:hypothetical protein n=1 Tax=Micromonospora sp. CA-259024 TaxID=3239965 RepID=UPI003D8BA973
MRGHWVVDLGIDKLVRYAAEAGPRRRGDRHRADDLLRRRESGSAIALDGDLLYVANQNSHSVVTLTAGRAPEPTGQVLEIGSPARILV